MSKTTSRPASPDTGGSKLFIGLLSLLVVGGVFVIALLASNRTSDAVAEQTAAVTLTGDPLTPLPLDVRLSNAATDPEAGTIAPTLTGTDFDGNEVVIEPDGRAKAIYFLAHWCPHCQAEVPAVQELISEGALPDGMDVYAVSTGVDPGQGNYPPQVWLADEGFEPPTIRDDASSTAIATFGGSSFPYAIYLDADHRVVARSAGQAGKDTIASLWQSTVDGN